MKLVFKKRTVVRAIIPVLALVLIASVVAGREKPAQAPVQPASRIDAKVSSRAALEQELDITPLVRKADQDKVDPSTPAAAADPFARRSFGVPQQPAGAAPAAQAAPTAPALPFRYLGKAIEDGKLTVFLMRGNDSFSVHAKQELDSEYRVDKVTESQVVFTYLPLKTKQTLDIPAAN